MLCELFNVLTGRHRRQKRCQVAGGVLLGLLSGFTAGVLLAPQAGKDTRKDILDAANKGAKKTKDYAQKAGRVLKEKSTDVFDAAREKCSALFSKGEDAVEDAAKKARAAARDARRKAREKAAETAETVEETAEDVKEELED